MTASLNLLIYDHLTSNHILCEEQKGCSKGTKGCKEQLIIDQVILEQAYRNNRNLYAAYIDYQKAFDSVPHNWILKTLRMYKVIDQIVNFLKESMTKWRTKLYFMSDTRQEISRTIGIKCGIFQLDCLSPLLVCIAMNPLSNTLKETQYGFKIKTAASPNTVSYLLYMDDSKLYAATKNQL